MKVAFLMIYGDLGGAEYVAFQHALIAKNSGIDVIGISTLDGVIGDRFRENNMEFVVRKELLSEKVISTLEELLRGVDVVYNCNYWSVSGYVGLLKKKLGFRFISIVHSNVDWVFDQIDKYDNFIDSYLATSDLIEQQMIDKGVPISKIYNIPNGIDTSLIPESGNDIREKLKSDIGIPKEDIVIGMTTRISYDKNIMDIVRIVDKVNEYIPISLVIIGDACYTQESRLYKENILSAISKSKYKEKYHLLGKLPSNEDIYYTQRIFDIGINTSPSEGLPISLLEQMCAGIYCIYPGIGGIPELLTGYGSILPIQQRIDSTIFYKKGWGFDENEIELYVDEIIKCSKLYRSIKGVKARQHIINTRDINLFSEDITSFIKGKGIKHNNIQTPPAVEMKLGVVYNVFDDIDILRIALDNMRPVASYICVVYQNISYDKSRVVDNVYALLKELKTKGMIDDIIPFVPSNIVSPKLNEIKKRNIGINYCDKNKCNYYICLDADELFTTKQLIDAKEFIKNSDYDFSVCKMKTYYKFTDTILFPPEEYFIPFITKMDDRRYVYNYKSEYSLDSGRSLPYSKCYEFTREEIEMHHYSFVMKDIEVKINTQPTSIPEDNKTKILSSWNDYEYGKKVCTNNGWFDTMKVHDEFSR